MAAVKCADTLVLRRRGIPFSRQPHALTRALRMSKTPARVGLRACCEPGTDRARARFDPQILTPKFATGTAAVGAVRASQGPAENCIRDV